MHPLRLVRSDGNARNAQKTTGLKWIRVRLTVQSMHLGAPTNGEPENCRRPNRASIVNPKTARQPSDRGRERPESGFPGGRTRTDFAASRRDFARRGA